MDAINQSRKELRFVTSPEQMIPLLNRIRDTKLNNDDSDDQNVPNENSEFFNDISKRANQLTTILVQPVLSTVATSAAIAIPNIYEEYVNFIDLSVLNPIIDAASCQRDRLVESEISEQRFSISLSLFFSFLYCFVFVGINVS